jgi:UDP-3-O-[3-hydroxymyristoyl] N-acetylglucosamine deacetylase/3-hydroxyacyl-[acyl-carrier-protein] dehydratase
MIINVGTSKVLQEIHLFFKCSLIHTHIRKRVCHMQANAYANGKLVAKRMAQIAKSK